MAFITIPSSWIEVGRPTKKELFERIKDNFDDHESRLVTAESSVNQAQVYEEEVFGQLQLFGVKDGVFYFRLPTNISLLSGRIVQYKTSGSGTFQADIKFKRGVDPYTSIFTVAPSVTVANGDNYVSINGTLAESGLLAGDLLRVDFLSVQTNSADGHWSIIMEYEVA